MSYQQTSDYESYTDSWTPEDGFIDEYDSGLEPPPHGPHPPLPNPNVTIPLTQQQVIGQLKDLNRSLHQELHRRVRIRNNPTSK